MPDRQAHLNAQGGEHSRFSIVSPNTSIPVSLSKGPATTRIPLPDRYKRENVLVEVVSGRLRASAAHFSNQLHVNVTEPAGQLQVLDENGRPLPRTYVKTYARSAHGKVSFYKDG